MSTTAQRFSRGLATGLRHGLVIASILVAVFGCGAVRAAESTAATSPTALSADASHTPTAAATATNVAVVPSAAAKPRADGAGSNAAERLQITDAYVELRTGPGRGFPVFFVAGRGAWVEIELRHTDWYRVRTDDGKVGWVVRQQLESTLTAAGGQKSFRDVLLDDFLSRHVQLGASWGHFKSEPMLKLWTSYRLAEAISVEGTLGQVQGVFSGTDFWHLNLVVEPWADRRFSPFLGVGVGKFKNFPNLSLIGAAATDAKLANAQIGARYYLTDRFVVRADYSLYTAFVSDTRTNEYRAFTAGVSFFF